MDARAILTVLDDGGGCDATVVPVVGYSGLLLIRDTVAVAGGTLPLDSQMGRATRVELSPPQLILPDPAINVRSTTLIKIAQGLHKVVIASWVC